MKKSLSLKTISAMAVASLALTGCVEDTYDMDDLNTDVEVRVNDLVVPIKLDAITLSNAFDLDPESVIKDINGEYAVVVDGDFTSDAIKVNGVVVKPVSIGAINCDIYEYSGSDIDWPVDAQTISYEITPAVASFGFSCNNVSRTIRDLKSVECSWTIDVDLSLVDANHLFSKLDFKRLVLNIPAGLHVSNYPCTDGKVTIGDLSINLVEQTKVTLLIDRIDMTKFDSKTFSFTPAAGDLDNGSIVFNGTVGVESGFVVGQTRQSSTAEYQKVTLDVTPDMKDIVISSITGAIGYSIDGLNVADVALSDLPDMLREEGTDVSIANPQLYLSLNNPVANYGLTAESGLTLTSMQNGNEVNKCSLNAGSLILLTADKGVAGPYNYCLSPSKPDAYYAGYENADHVGFASLSGLLSGNGLPDYIKVDFDKPNVKSGQVTNFRLDTTIDPVKGNYTLYAPLELTVGSHITYEEDETGWDDETIRKITITTLKVTATVTNSLPVDIEVSGTPLDVDGNACVDPATKKPVKLHGFTVPAGETANIELKNEGTIVGIDGIHYAAKCQVTKAGQVLKAESPITISNIKVTVGGYYRDTL